jgi:hypothetical protein
MHSGWPGGRGASLSGAFDLEWNALPDERLLVRPLRTSYGFINHCFEPNVEIGPDYRTIRALRAIAVGKELTLDDAAQPVPKGYLERDDTGFMRAPYQAAALAFAISSPRRIVSRTSSSRSSRRVR